jgi:hypothetical protein
VLKSEPNFVLTYTEEFATQINRVKFAQLLVVLAALLLCLSTLDASC